MVQLVIAEKPAAAKKIAEALGNGKVEKKSYRTTVSYYEVGRGKDKILVASAVGHLFNLDETEKQGWKYPVFSLTWKPSYELGSSLKYIKTYVDCLQKLAKEADSFVVACDLDQEGELIGYNVLRYICHVTDASRVEFSTLTKEDLQQAFAQMKPHINMALALAGETRHILDHYWGINLSRALSLSVKHATGTFRLLSTGRVQGPTLHILYEREQEITVFVSQPYWTVMLDCGDFLADHITEQFWKKEEAETVVQKITGEKYAVVDSLESRQAKKSVPLPFDLTSLQLEAYRVLRLSPKRTMDIAQDLYTNGWISYPRTSSQKLPVSLGFKKILQKLQKLFSSECSFLLGKKELVPKEGKKTDPAHPAIYPTGDLPQALQGKSAQLYELICRRFFSVFGEDAVRETVTVMFVVCGERFQLQGTRTVEQGWFSLYGSFVKLEEKELPHFTKGDTVPIHDVLFDAKETQPPKRYTEASLVKELEKRNLGTKATRATIIENLFARHYIVDSSLRVTELGMKTVETLQKYCPEVLDEALTRKFEEEMEGIAFHDGKPEPVLAEAKDFLVVALDHFKKHEKAIGNDLGGAVLETIKKESYVGVCPSCKEGNVHYRKGKFGLFLACSRYPDCKFTVGIPSGSFVKGADSSCSVCSWPEIYLIKNKRKKKVCINLTCSTKDKDLGDVTICPKCSSALAVKKTLYGGFIACSSYPKCRYIVREKKEVVVNENVEE